MSARKVKALVDVNSEGSDLHGVKKGDILDIEATTVHQQRRDGKFYNECEVVTVLKNGARKVTVPLYLGGTYEEVGLPGEDGQSKKLKLDDIDLDSLPLNVELVDPPTKFAPSRNPLPLNVPIQLLFSYQDECVMCSKDVARMFSCPVPLHTGIEVRYVSRYPRSNKVPELSPLEGCPQDLCLGKIESLREESEYEVPENILVNRAPVLPPRNKDPDDRSLTLPTPSRSGPPPTIPGNKASTISGPGSRAAPPPIPERKKLPTSIQRSASTPAEKSSIAKPLKKLLAKIAKGTPHTLPAQTSGPTPRRPPPQKPTVQDSESDTDDEFSDMSDYEDVTTAPNYQPALAEIFGHTDPPTIDIPGDEDISGFSWAQMVVFLQLMQMPAQSLLKVATQRMDGRRFSELSDSELAQNGINHPLIRRYRARSRPVSDDLIEL